MANSAAPLCPGCFKHSGGARPCPHCGFDETAPRPVQALPLRTVLHDQFIVGRVLGKPGGFGITYLGRDQMLEAIVAIKEYLPRELAVRAQDSRTLHPHSADEAELFRYGLEQFLAEARTLAKLDHPNLVRIRQFFEANGTAYLVMDYYQGCSLAEHLETLPGSRLSEPDALALMQPILDGLRAVHAKGFLHRDIKPQNIYLAQTDSGGVRPILLDFGAARQAMGERSRSLSVVISPGYAPFEQYHRKGQQGPATDIYGAAAVLYRMLTGVVPPEATERMAGDELRPAAEFGIRAPVSAALTQALAMKVDQRPASVAAFQQGLQLSIACVEDRLSVVARTGTVPPKIEESESATPLHRNVLEGQWSSGDKENWVFLFGISFVVLLVGLVAMARIMSPQPMPEPVPKFIPDRYQDLGDGTLIDLTTKLHWMRCSLGQKWTGNTCEGSVNWLRWDSIMPNGEQKSWPEFAGYSNWRVPTIEELKTLVYCSSGQPSYWKTTSGKCGGNYIKPTIYAAAFPNQPSNGFWSASSEAWASSSNETKYFDPWLADFNEGDVGIYRDWESYAVRLVRDK